MWETPILSASQQPVLSSSQAPRGPYVDLMPSRVPLCKAHAERSAQNISLWNSYLPAACVRTMVRLGWDVST
jgi:hypothetical protein